MSSMLMSSNQRTYWVLVFMRREESSFVTVLMKRTSPRLNAWTTHGLLLPAQFLVCLRKALPARVPLNPKRRSTAHSKTPARAITAHQSRSVVECGAKHRFGCSGTKTPSTSIAGILSVGGVQAEQGAREGAKVSKDLEGQAPRVPIRIIIAHSDRGEEQFPTRASHP
jgi:hypothetical protein